MMPPYNSLPQPVTAAEAAERMARLAYFDAVAPALRNAIETGRHETIAVLLEGLRRATTPANPFSHLVGTAPPSK